MSLLETLGALSVWAYVLIFVAAVAEALPAIGTLVPGHSIVIAGGAAASLGYLNPWVVFAVATVGAVGGDAAAYWMGRSQGRRFLERHGTRFGLTPPRVERSAQVLARNPFVAIVGGRFSAVTRAIVPFVAGCLSFRFGRFSAYNVIGAILWAGSSVLIGFLVGASYHAAEKVVGRFLLVALLALVGLSLAYRLVRLVSPSIRRADAVAFLAAAAGVALFWVAAANVAEGDHLANLDPKAAAFLDAHYTPGLGRLMEGISFLGSGTALWPAGLLAGGMLLWRRRPWQAFLIALVALAEQVSVQLSKALMARVRPDLPHVAAAGFSFPSGHTTAATVVAVLAVWFAAGRPRWQVAWTLGLAALWVALMGTSRMVLRVHYFTDVVGGIGLGLAVAGGVLCAPGMWRGVRARLASRPVKVPLEKA
ncbi:MAG TPA: bifunctional DedA family/phosphatase PAP2 family protein [Candidatus Thermoplasmatota archaeon]|nr:bifunctional DedA family/phosphatase PAP2 family protein [Candidatus Thermoplasmatota archaeon]